MWCSSASCQPCLPQESARGSAVECVENRPSKRGCRGVSWQWTQLWAPEHIQTPEVVWNLAGRQRRWTSQKAHGSAEWVKTSDRAKGAGRGTQTSENQDIRRMAEGQRGDDSQVEGRRRASCWSHRGGARSKARQRVPQVPTVDEEKGRGSHCTGGDDNGGGTQEIWRAKEEEGGARRETFEEETRRNKKSAGLVPVLIGGRIIRVLFCLWDQEQDTPCNTACIWFPVAGQTLQHLTQCCWSRFKYWSIARELFARNNFASCVLRSSFGTLTSSQVSFAVPGELRAILRSTNPVVTKPLSCLLILGKRSEDSEWQSFFRHLPAWQTLLFLLTWLVLFQLMLMLMLTLFTILYRDYFCRIWKPPTALKGEHFTRNHFSGALLSPPYLRSVVASFWINIVINPWGVNHPRMVNINNGYCSEHRQSSTKVTTHCFTVENTLCGLHGSYCASEATSASQGECQTRRVHGKSNAHSFAVATSVVARKFGGYL